MFRFLVGNKMFANAGPSGEPTATPSICRASAQIFMVSASGALVKRLEMSKEQRKTEEAEKINFLTSFRKVKESDTIRRKVLENRLKKRSKPFS